MIYRVHLYDDADGSAGYVYTGSHRIAHTRLLEWVKESPSTRTAADIDHVPTPRNKREMVTLLNRWASHEDNG